MDPLDKTLVTRGHMFARYADDSIVMVASDKGGSTGHQEPDRLGGRLPEAGGQPGQESDCTPASMHLVPVSRSAGPGLVAFGSETGFQVGANGKVVWSEKAKERFKLRIRQITSRNRGCHVRDVIDGLRRYVSGWINYFGISHTCKSVLALDKWLRRRVRLYYWFRALRQDRARS